jgi:zinc protease
MGYHVPVLSTDDNWEPYALSVASAVLDGGSAARFSRELVRGKEIAVSAGAGYGSIGRAPDLFELDATPADGKKVEELERALREQIARLRDELVSEAELKRVKAQVRSSDVFARDSVFYQGMQLGQLATLGLDLRLIDSYADRVQTVTAEQVRAVARKYLIDTNLTVAILDPLPMKEGAKPAGHSAGGSNHVR